MTAEGFRSKMHMCFGNDRSYMHLVRFMIMNGGKEVEVSSRAIGGELILELEDRWNRLLQ